MSARAFGRTPLDLAFAPDTTGLLLAAILALVCYLAALGGFTLVLLADDARAWNRSLGISLTLQIPAETSAPRIEMAVALLRQTSGIASVRALDAAEIARLLEPWLGTAAATDTLPIPRLVDVQIEPGTEHLVGTADDNGAHRFVIPRLRKRRQQRIDQVHAERIDRRAIEHDLGNIA